MGKKFEAPDISLVEKLTAQLLAANAELAEANRRLHESERTRTEMFQNISHDLRAPLTAIRGVMDRLMHSEGMTEEERRSVTGIMDQRVAALEHLVAELYYLSSLELPGFALKMAALPVVPFLEEWFIGRRSGADCARRRLLLETAEGAELRAMIDPDHMARVLDNLMDNALSFTGPRDTIALGCRNTQPPGGVEISLRDTGCGIREEFLPYLFERTYTDSSSRTPSGHHRTGLGLHIAKIIVEKHGGSISCESRPKEGSTFFIRLPALNT